MTFLFIKKLQKWIYTLKKKKIWPDLIQVLIQTWHQIKTHLQSDSQTHKREIEQFHVLVAETPLPSAKDGGLDLPASLMQP